MEPGVSPPARARPEAYDRSVHAEREATMRDALREAFEASNLRSLPADTADALLTGSQRQHVEAGTILRREGDDRPHLDLVVAGVLRVFVTAPDGRTLTVRYVRQGGLLGAVSLFAPSFALPGTIQAVTAADLLRFDPRLVRRTADSDVRVARALIDELTERVMSFIPEIPGGAFATVRQRLARHLLDLAGPSVPGRALVVGVTQRELAAAVGTVREVVVRALRQLREAGLVQSSRDGLVILDPEGLAAEAYPRSGPGQGWNPGS
jgi:CRP/FNR family transcriptional regulator, cyclic AMP receptor protein